MAAVDTKPSANPANYDSMVGMMKEVLDHFLQETDDMLPAIVMSYDRDKKVAQVQPLIMRVTASGSPISRAPVAAVPVVQMGAGGFVLDFNLKKGDFGYIKANDRDISLFRQSFTESKPNTYRKHTFQDAVFFPAPMTGYAIEAGEEEACVLRTLDGTQRVVIMADGIKVYSDTVITLDAPLVTITGDLVGTGTRATGTASFNGIIHSSVDVTGGTEPISLVHHIHSGVQSGSGDTGPPV